MTPDNKDIALIHLGQNIPQRIINLGTYEFVSFVQGAFERTTTSKQILLLVRKNNTQEVRLVMIKADPWKPIDRGEPFDMPENFFVIDGTIA